jgi:prevent-host-death family protein
MIRTIVSSVNLLLRIVLSLPACGEQLSSFGWSSSRQAGQLAYAKAHLSELIDAAEHRGERVLILRHWNPAAAIVPVDVATPRARTVAPTTTS